jgi:hypothetical protein
MKTSFEFLAGMYFDGNLHFNRYSIGIDFFTVGDAAHDQNVALDRISYFMYDVVGKSVFIHEDEKTQIEALNKANISVLTTPAPGPFDPIIQSLIVTKMNAIADGVLDVSESEFVSDISGPIVYVWDAVDDDDEIHKMVNGDDETKWWASPDPRFGSYPAGVDVAAVEEKQPFPITWESLGLGWVDETEENDVDVILDTVTKGKGNSTIIKADFNPPKPKKK